MIKQGYHVHAGAQQGALGKQLTDGGLDAGAHTIAWHLEREGSPVPAASTIWRILVRRGFVTPEPRKRPKSSYVRFQR